MERDCPPLPGPQGDIESEGDELAFCVATFNTPAGSVLTIAQIVPVAGVEFVWVDGVNADSPILLRLDAIEGVQKRLSAGTFFAERSDLVAQLAVHEDLTDVTPTVLARTVIDMGNGASSAVALGNALDVSWLLERIYREARTGPLRV